MGRCDRHEKKKFSKFCYRFHFYSFTYANNFTSQPMGTDDGMLFLSLSSFPPSLLGNVRFISLGSLGCGLTFILGLQFDIDDGVLWLILLWFGIESEPRTLVARQLTVRAPLLSIWEVARSQLEHVSFGLLELLPHHYDDHNEHRQQDQDAANGHSHHGAVTHLRDLCELWVCSSSPLHCSAWSDLWAVWNTKHLHISLSHISQTRLSVHNWDQPWMERAKSPAKLWHWYMYLGLPLSAPSTLCAPWFPATLVSPFAAGDPKQITSHKLWELPISRSTVRKTLPLPASSGAPSIAVARSDSLWTAQNLSHVASFALCSSKSDWP